MSVRGANSSLINPGKAPKTFKGYDFCVASEVVVKLADLQKWIEVEEKSDDLGTCLVSHFHVQGTAAFFYRSEQYSADKWMLFVDMSGCTRHRQMPTKLAERILKALGIDDQIWINKALDKIYRMHSQELPELEAPRKVMSVKAVDKLTRPHYVPSVIDRATLRQARLAKYHAAFERVEKAVLAGDKYGGPALVRELESVVTILVGKDVSRESQPKKKAPTEKFTRPVRNPG